MNVRVRFAPSPTGFLHIGSVRTALFNWLYARHTGGTFVLRIEDTDTARNTEQSLHTILDGLKWLGLDHDEGPYFQSQRAEVYRQHCRQLVDAGHAYEREGAIRFKMTRVPITVPDLIAGNVTRELADRELQDPDFVIVRSDGNPVFHFVNVVDDMEMKITHVIRGEDHLSNTPKHIALFRAFGVEPPQYAHIPMILNPDGTKMSKSDPDPQKARLASLQYYQDEGYLKEALRNYLCLLGWSPKDNREIIPIDDVIKLFDLPQILRANARFDLAKLAWMNYEYMRLLPIDSSTSSSSSYSTADSSGSASSLSTMPSSTASPSSSSSSSDWLRASSDSSSSLSSSSTSGSFFEVSRKFLEPEWLQNHYYTVQALSLVRDKIKLAKDVPKWIDYFFTDDYPFDPEAVKKSCSAPQTTERLTKLADKFTPVTSWDAASLESALKALATELGVKTGELIHPCRVAVSGKSAGPSLYHMLEVLGRDRVLARLRRAAERFQP